MSGVSERNGGKGCGRVVTENERRGDMTFSNERHQVSCKVHEKDFFWINA